jgi:hypothetical protein
MYKLLFLLLLITSVVGCSLSSGNKKIAGTHMQDDVYVKYVNQKGEDLLNPDHAHAITESNTNLYYLINGKKKKIFKGNLDYPKMFRIGNDFISDYHDYVMVIFANTPRGQNTATTYIAFEDYPTDTLKVQYETGNGVAVTKAWYNGKLRYDVYNNNYDNNAQKVITVTKHFSNK